MRDIPFFTTQQGVASLTLSQIPYTHKAYIRIQDSAFPEMFLNECIGFCKAAGAEQVYVTGHEVCEQYPEYTKLLFMQADRSFIGETDAALFPVTSSTLERWVEIYNHIYRIPLALPRVLTVHLILYFDQSKSLLQQIHHQVQKKVLLHEYLLLYKISYRKYEVYLPYL